MNHDTQMQMSEWLDREQLPRAVMQSIEQVYEPLANRIRLASASSNSPHVVGLCGPQGSGKSTIASILLKLLSASDRKVAIVALDDFYLPRSDRQQLATTIHPLLATRGVPGTHDVALMERTLTALSERTTVAIPRFDKASDDRKPPVDWASIEAPVDVIVFEGWCVGACAEDEAALEVPANALEEREDPRCVWRRFVNARLREDYQRVFARIDELILLKAPGFEVVYQWRAEQEQKLRDRLMRAGHDTSRLMEDAALRRFISHYERLTRHILTEMPARADVVIEMDSTRRVERVRGL